jgi:hypothetical protein
LLLPPPTSMSFALRDESRRTRASSRAAFVARGGRLRE